MPTGAVLMVGILPVTLALPHKQKGGASRCSHRPSEDSPQKESLSDELLIAFFSISDGPNLSWFRSSDVCRHLACYRLPAQ